MLLSISVIFCFPWFIASPHTCRSYNLCMTISTNKQEEETIYLCYELISKYIEIIHMFRDLEVIKYNMTITIL